MDDAWSVVTGQPQAHLIGLGYDGGCFDLLGRHVQTLVAQYQQVGEEFIDPVVADLHHHDTGERPGDLGQLTALPVALVKTNDVGE